MFAPAETDPDPRLLARAESGDQRALAALWRSLNPPLLRYLRGRIGDLADDVAAQTWLDAVRGLAGFDGDESDFRRWLFTIARRRLIDALRRRGRRPERLEADVADGGRLDPAIGRVDDLAWALDLVRRLPPHQADAVLLRVVADLDVDQVAAVMGRSEGAVRVLVHRGLRRLQRLARQQHDGSADWVTDDEPLAMYREP
jgi:RNA polymerase sigma-70 factor (ECF subfamily)